MLTITVRNLPRSMTEQELTGLFAAHGRVHGLKLARDLFTGECRGFAEVQMEGHEARAAIAALDGSMQGASAIRVALARQERRRR
jgi:RNA recognition motif-containing protein